MLKAKIVAQKGDFLVDAEFQAPGGCVTALMGPSGSGKTTILRAIAGLDRHPGCRIAIDENVWQDEVTFFPTHKRAVGYVFQEPSLFPHLSVKQNIAYGIKRVCSKELDMKVTMAAKAVGIGQLRDRKPSELSGGESQRVALARALAVNPYVLLMDEPVSSLDLALKNEVLESFERIHQERAVPVIYVSHSADEVARVADRLILLEKGKIVAEGPLAEVLTRLDLDPAHRDDAEAVIDAVADGYDAEFGISTLDFAGGRFSVPGPPIEKGKPVRLRLAARDVSITLEKQTETSILNIFPSRVVGVAESGEYQMTVLLSVSGARILARVTKRSASALGLAPGKEVFAQAKSVAVIA